MRAWIVLLGFLAACGGGGSGDSKKACENFCECLDIEDEECVEECDAADIDEAPDGCIECLAGADTCDVFFDECEDVCNPEDQLRQ